MSTSSSLAASLPLSLYAPSLSVFQQKLSKFTLWEWKIADADISYLLPSLTRSPSAASPSLAHALGFSKVSQQQPLPLTAPSTPERPLCQDLKITNRLDFYSAPRGDKVPVGSPPTILLSATFLQWKSLCLSVMNR